MKISLNDEEADEGAKENRNGNVEQKLIEDLNSKIDKLQLQNSELNNRNEELEKNL